MTDYRGKQRTEVTKWDFPLLLRKAVDGRIRQAEQGLNLNSIYEGGGKKVPVREVHRAYSMLPDIFDLGVRMKGRFPKLSPHVWANWMMNTRIEDGIDSVRVYQRSQFYNEGTQERLGWMLAEYFEKPVLFYSDQNIAHEVGVDAA